MDKKEREIFEEVINNLKALQERVDTLEHEVASLKGFSEPVSDVNEVIDLEIDDLDLNPVVLDNAEVAGKKKTSSFDDFLSDFEPVTKVHDHIGTVPEEAPAEEEVPAEEVAEEETTVEEEQTVEEEAPVEEEVPAEEEAPVEEVAEVEPAVEEEQPVEEEVLVEEEIPAEEEAPVKEVAELEPAEEDEQPKEEEPVAESDLFGEMSLFGEVAEPVARSSRKRKTLNDTAHSNKAVIDVMAEKLAWKHDMPGSEVKDIKSAISLNDRVLFISSLFREDSMLYQDTMHKLNDMSSLDEAVKYLGETFPEWNLESDSVYRFMMAVRRKLR